MRRPAPPRDIPPPLELECLKELWGLGEASVKDVRQSLMRSRNLAYTTVMTVLERLVKRGCVSRRREGRAFLYQPVTGRDTLRRLAVRDLVDSLFEGSPEALREYLRGLEEPAPEPVYAPAPATGSLDTALL